MGKGARAVGEPTLVMELVFLSGSFKGRRILLQDRPLYFGRDATCDVALDDEAASRRHAEVRLKGGVLHLKDLDSTNGTFVNDARVKETELHSGDRMAIGDTVLLVEIRPSPAPAPVVLISQERPAQPAKVALHLEETRFLELREGTSLQEARQQVTQLCEFTALVSRQLHLPALLERAVDFLLGGFGAERGAILLLDADGRPGLQVARTAAGSEQAAPMSISRALVQDMVQQKQSQISEEAETRRNRVELRSMLAVPLKVKDRLLGLLFLDRRVAEAAFTRRNLELCTAMAVQLAICLENALLYTELLDAAEFNNQILRSMAGGLLAVNLEGRITRVNRAALEILQQEEAALMNRRISDIPPLEPLARVVEATLATGKPEDRYELDLLVDGEPIPLGLTTALLANHAGEEVGVVASFRNLSALRRLEEQLRRSQHLAALGQMAAGVAHEIRNPLNSVRGFTQLIREQALKSCSDQRCGEYARIVIEEVDRMNRIVQDLLDYSRQRELPLAPLHVEDLLRGEVKELDPEFTKAQVPLELKLPHEPAPPVLGHADKLRQVFRNVLLNAVQASRPGQAVLVSLQPADSLSGRREITITFQDHGVGIPPEALPRIFDPFFSLKDTGVGLGLSISQKIVHEHGGQIKVHSRLAQGTTFTILLPTA